jgi:hypothetical protein
VTPQEVKENCLKVKPHLGDYEDPLGYLGFGIVSYFDLIKSMFFLFAVLSLVNLPTILIYKSYNNYSLDMIDNFHRTSTLGNLGFSMPKCMDTSMSTDTIILSCKNANGENRTLCRRNQIGKCATAFTEASKLEIDKCKGKDSC